MLDKINTGFILALMKRDLWKYFTNPTGYVFITLFIFLSAAAAFWQDRFFLNNLANLDHLNSIFPFLLVFFVPALTMPVWSEERKQGTDELLLTLPATSLEVVLGKYFATLGIYTASLLLSLSHVIVLLWLGSPDLGLMISNYIGYWLLGCAMIAIGLVASLLTANSTIAFVLGAIFCSFFAFAGSSASLSQTLGGLLSPLSVTAYSADFARGVVTSSGFLYFLSLTALMLYANVLLLERRHWSDESEGYPMWFHQGVRVAALLIAVICINIILGRTGIRLDATAERLHSLGGATYDLINELSEDRPVFIQAFVSPEVPEHLVQTRATLLDVLSEIDSIGGARVQVIIEETEPFTEEARDAREKFGISPRQVSDLRSAGAAISEVFLGIAFTCGAEEQVIPFLDRGLSTEYEITRSMRVVARTERRKIGVLGTEAKLFGGFDFQTMQSSPSWSVVEELRKQYEVIQISPSGAMVDDIDGLVAALPSSLSQEEMNHLLSYIQGGTPTLLLVDPLPIVNIGLAPSERAGANTNPFMRNQAPPPKEKGNIQELMSEIGVRWDSASIVWDSYNPHPDLSNLPPEVVFLGSGNDNENTFNHEHRGSAELQEVVFLYPGQISAAAQGKYKFEPLLRSGFASGRLNYSQMVQRSFLGVQLNQNLPHHPDLQDTILAAHITGPLKPTPAPSDTEPSSENPNDSQEIEPSGLTQKLNVIVVADLDFISQQFFEIRRMGPGNLNFDNVTFFLNCIDVLIGDESFIALRNKRVRHRTLERVEEQTQNFVEERLTEEQEAETEAEQALTEAQQRLDDRVNKVRQRVDLDAQTKQIMARNLQEVENRRLEVLKANIEAEKEARISRSKEKMEEQVRQIQSSIKACAVLLPPIPVFALGVMIFLRRQRRETEGAAAARRLRS